MTAAFKISSSVFFQTPPLIMILMVASGGGARGRPVQPLCVALGARRRGARVGRLAACGRRSLPRAAAGEAGAPPQVLLRGAAGRALRDDASFAWLAELRTPVSQL